MDALAKIGPDAAAALPDLLARLGSFDPSRSQHVRGTEGALPRALGALGPVAVESLTHALDVPSKRLDALRALFEAGPSANPARGRVRELLRNENEAVRRAADRTLDRIEFGSIRD